MEIGVFIPIGNNGWLISEAAPQYMPSFALNKEITQKAEKYGFDFALSMIKLRGFGGKTQFWEHNLESFTLMAGLAAVTVEDQDLRHRRHPDHPAGHRRAHGLDHRLHRPGPLRHQPGDRLAEGRVRPDGPVAGRGALYRPLQLPGRIRHRAARPAGNRRLDFKGKYFQMEDCRVSPHPEETKLICAGSSNEGLAFTAQYADYSFALGKGTNTPTAFGGVNDRLKAAADKTGRDVASYILFMIIADETDEAAMAKWQAYRAGADQEALAWLTNQAAPNAAAGSTTNTAQLAARSRR
jgi:pyrimidine oxygenase